MPNFVINSVYQPFSFQERITPLAMMKEEYEKVGESLSELGDNVNQYYNYLDPESKAVVDGYNQTLSNVADAFSREGLKTVSRNTLFNLKRAYNSQILPINKAAENYASLQEQLRRAKLADPTLLIGNVPTVSDLLKNPNATPSMVSGETLYKAGVSAASQIPNLTYDQIMSGNIPNLEEVINSVASAYGVDDIDSEAGRAQILRGITAGVGAIAKDLETERAKLEIKDEFNKREFNRKAWLEQQDRNATMLRSGFVPDAKSPGGYKLDPSLAMSLGSKSSTSGSSKTSNSLAPGLNDKVWGTSRVVLGRERDTAVKNFVDKKTGRIIITDDAFDKDGYYHLPEETRITYSPGQFGATVSGTSKDPKQKKLYDVLSQYYTDDELTNMKKSDIERAIRSLVDEANLDGQQTNVYRWNLNASDTKEFISSVGKGKKFNEIKRKNDDGSFSYKSGVDLDSDKGSGHILYDANTNTVLLQYNNSYYRVPMSVISSEYLDALQSIVGIGKDGLSELRKTQINIESVQNEMARVQDYYELLVKNNQPVPNDIITYYNQLNNSLIGLMNNLSEYDSVLSNIGNHIMSHTGNRNLNTN